MALVTIKPNEIDRAITHAIARKTRPVPEEVARAVTWGADERLLLALAALEPLAQLPGVSLVSLQKGAGLEQLRDVPFAERIIDLSADLDRGPDAFLDTAAVMAGLDLVISSDTSVAHLAGALGRPVWTVLAASPEWR